MANKQQSAAIITMAVSSILLLLCNGCVPFNYFPASKISVQDVFGKPCKNISITAQDRTSMYPLMEGYHESYSPIVNLTTNELGECEIPGRFRFAMPFVNAVRVGINSDNYWFPIGQLNGTYDSARVLIDKGTDVQITLRPLDIDYRICNSILDESRRSSCLLFSSFFSAIREGDPNICNNYDFNNVKYNQVRHSKEILFYWEGIDFHYKKDACITMVALKTNNKELCERLNKREDGFDGFGRKSKCLAAFEDPGISGMIGVSNEAFQHFICSEHDWSANDERYRRYLAKSFDHGIFLYRKTCRQTPASAQ